MRVNSVQTKQTIGLKKERKEKKIIWRSTSGGQILQVISHEWKILGMSGMLRNNILENLDLFRVVEIPYNGHPHMLVFEVLELSFSGSS